MSATNYFFPALCRENGTKMKAAKGATVAGAKQHLDDIEGYRELVRVARLHAAQQGLSLPTWELLYFNSVRQL